MNKQALTISFLGVLLTGAVASAQLPTGTYLVGTQGWDSNNKPDPQKFSVQLVNTYDATAKLLTVNGRPGNEIPSAFLIENPNSFLMGTKLAAAPAAGNIYRVTHVANSTWSASQLNTSPLNINVNSMVKDGAYIYACGSAVFGTYAGDAQIMRVAQANGTVTVHAQFGESFVGSQGAHGIGSSMILVGNTLHTFTFDSRTMNPANNIFPRTEHFQISTSTPATFSKVGADLPLAKRLAARGFAATGVVRDAQTGDLVVVSRWGEFLYRTTSGVDIRHRQRPGNLSFANLTELPRAVGLNTDTGAIAMGDHQNASIDELRGNGITITEDIVSCVAAGAGTYTVAAITYVPASAFFLPIADGCPMSTDGVPSNYPSSPPTAGNLAFKFTVTTAGRLAVLAVGARLATPLDFGSLGAPGCLVHVRPFATVLMQTTGSLATFPAPIPAGIGGINAYVQAVVLDSGANALGAVVSDTRRLFIP